MTPQNQRTPASDWSKSLTPLVLSSSDSCSTTVSLISLGFLYCRGCGLGLLSLHKCTRQPLFTQLGNLSGAPGCQPLLSRLCSCSCLGSIPAKGTSPFLLCLSPCPTRHCSSTQVSQLSDKEAEHLSLKLAKGASLLCHSALDKASLKSKFNESLNKSFSA